MKQILQDYIEYLKIPQWNNADKQIRHQTIQNWHKKEYQESISYEELKEFEKFAEEEGYHHYKTYFFFEKITFDVYHRELVEKRNLEVLKYLYRTNGRMFCNDKKGIEIDLLELGLQIDENDVELLKYKLKSEIEFLRFTIHEVPWIVIAFGANSASGEDTKKLFKILDETVGLSQKLNETIDEKLINDCIFYWTHWIDFLETKNEYYPDFEKYLEQIKT